MHQEKHFTASEIVRDVIIGMSDGLTVPFALTAGLSGVVHANSFVITAGIAEIVAGSIAMGLGGFLSAKTEIEHYQTELQREYAEVERIPEQEKDEVKEVFANYGLSEKLQNDIAEQLSLDKDQWVDFMMRFELGMEKPDPKRAKQSAFNIGISYVLGGFIPLLAYFFTNTPEEGLRISAIITIIALFAFGYFKTKLTGQKPLEGAFKTVLIGALAAGAAFGIAKLIS
ncbi:VIT1/CCC1 transporter family protein [Pedobacter sp. SD-b]|uniref:VIT1/CCC1 transporter family protein n=1 Tax=Pedobacter segetis TaxID=2793069 RepID=A0ABS1BFN7_9SPHI|nr:VIT1/CCC1 transporter family protein [Pedobacter segetis]MBK0381643.1 VIT1/CCC1 transporter family protein [Pedobacter segetis]